MSLNMRGGTKFQGGIILGRFMVAPHDISLSANVVNENSSIGLVFSTATASDVNSNEVFTWALTSNPGNKFAIHPTNGNLSVNGSLDFETASSHNITVQVTDKDGLTYSESFTINVSNVNEPPVDINISSNQSWGMTANSTVIGTATATDPDAGDISTWDLTSNPGGYYAINNTNGQITKAVKYAPAGLNSITIRATDTAANTYTEAFNIDNAYLREDFILTESAGSANDSWGRFVSLDSDGDTMVVSAWFDDQDATDAGTVYVYTRSGSTWTKQARLIPSFISSNANYGFRAVLSGDGNTVVVGARTSDYINNDAGAVFVFTRTAGVWTQQAQIIQPTNAAENQFGSGIFLASSGDHVVVGEPFRLTGGVNRYGAAHVYFRSGGTWNYHSTITPPVLLEGAGFGEYVSGTPDAQTIAISSTYQTVSGNAFAGAVHIYDWNGSSYVYNTTLTRPTPLVLGYFGSEDGSFSNDGTVFTVGSYAENSEVGATWVFRKTAGVWNLESQLIPTTPPVAFDRYGVSPVLLSDGSALVVGATLKDSTGIDEGEAYVFVKDGISWVNKQSFVPSTAPNATLFGVWVARSGDNKYMTISGHGGIGKKVIVYRTGL